MLIKVFFLTKKNVTVHTDKKKLVFIHITNSTIIPTPSRSHTSPLTTMNVEQYCRSSLKMSKKDYVLSMYTSKKKESSECQEYLLRKTKRNKTKERKRQRALDKRGSIVFKTERHLSSIYIEKEDEQYFA